MRPPRPDIAAPELPQHLEWVNGGPLKMQDLVGERALLVHFWDFAQLNALRSLPYVIEWHQRYGAAGLAVAGVHSPRWPATADPGAIAAAVERLGIPYPVAIDSELEVWRDYGVEGWPSLFLWGRDGALHWYHRGEGDYRDTELAIQEVLLEIDALRKMPEPMKPVRASDAPSAKVLPPSDEILPGGSLDRPWLAAEGEGELNIAYDGAGAYATADGLGELIVTIDGDDDHERRIPVAVPGLYQLASSGSHEHHTLRLRATEAVRLWSVAFAPGVPG